MRPDQLVEAVKNDLADWAAGLIGGKATISVAKDPWNALELLVQGPAGLIVVIHWAGDEDTGRRGDPKSNNTIEVIVAYNLGLTLPLSEALYKSTVARPSLLKYVSDVRSRLMTIEWPANETPQWGTYRGCESVTTPQGIPLAAYRLRIGLDAVVSTEAEYREAVYTA